MSRKYLDQNDDYDLKTVKDAIHIFQISQKDIHRKRTKDMANLKTGQQRILTATDDFGHKIKIHSGYFLCYYFI